MAATTRHLILLRHGRTSWNDTGRFQGQADIELDDTGLQQAADCAPLLADRRPTLLWTSDLRRAAATAEAVAQVTGLTAHRDPRLREIHVGRREGLTRAEFSALDPEEDARFQAGDRGYERIGGESVQQVASRTRAALWDVVRELADGETGIVAAHGAAIRIATLTMLGWPLQHLGSLVALDNCHWVELEVAGADSPAPTVRLAAYNLG